MYLRGIHVIKLVWFFPVNVSYINLIIRPAKEPRREEGKTFPPRQFLVFILLGIRRRGYCHLASSIIFADKMLLKKFLTSVGKKSPIQYKDITKLHIS